MHIIYLAGNSLNNKNWIEKIKSQLNPFSTGDILYYDHWQTGEKWIDLEKESEKLTKLVKDKKDYFVFAKSIGSVLALKNIFDKTLNPKRLIICGHPYRGAKKVNLPIDEYLKSLAVPTIFVQNEFDPTYSFKELENTLKENSPIDYHLIRNSDINTHDYEDFEKLSKIVGKFFAN
jgi:alpha-beta hydrolase superfamily lysophospholipase